MTRIELLLHVLEYLLALVVEQEHSQSDRRVLWTWHRMMERTKILWHS